MDTMGKQHKKSYYKQIKLIIFLLFFSKVYSVFSNTLNIQQCSIHCAFDSDNKCDYFSLQNQHCYLYNFNSGTSGNWHGYSNWSFLK